MRKTWCQQENGGNEWRNLTRHRIPSETVPGSVEEDGDDGGVVSLGDRLSSVSGAHGGQVTSDVDQAQTQTDGTDDKRQTTTDSIDHEETEDQGTNEFDGTVDTGGEERVFGSLEAELLEDSRTVVVDSLDATESLEEDQGETETNPLSVTFGRSKLLDETPQTRITSDGSFSFNGVVGHLDLVFDVGVVSRESSDVAECLDGLVVSVLAHQPSRRFGNEDCSDHQKCSWAANKLLAGVLSEGHTNHSQELHKDRQLPLELVRGQSSVDTVIDPETGESSNLNENIEETNESTSNRGWCKFGKVDRNDKRQETDSETAQESSNHKDFLETRAE